jgi:hypothetical protein
VLSVCSTVKIEITEGFNQNKIAQHLIFRKAQKADGTIEKVPSAF